LLKKSIKKQAQRKGKSKKKWDELVTKEENRKTVSWKSMDLKLSENNRSIYGVTAKAAKKIGESGKTQS